MTVAELKLDGLENVAFTSTQLRILDVLRDGEPHHKREIHACLPDDLASINAVHFHVSTIRGKIRDAGYLIMIQFQGYTPLYRLVKSVEQEEI